MAILTNPKWERFCQELLVDDNQTQAYIRAGYAGRGAGQSARRLLAEPAVAARMAELRTDRNGRIAERAELIDLYAHAKRERFLSNAIRVLELLGRTLSFAPSAASAPAPSSRRRPPSS